MGFFDRALHRPDPPSQPVRRQRPLPPWIKPETEVPGPVDVAPTVLARSEDVAIALVGIRAYGSGFEFDLCAVMRRAQRRTEPFWGMHGPGAYGEDRVPDEVLRVGLRFADGSIVTNVDRRVGGVDLDNEPRRPFLMTSESGGGQRRYDATYWIWPLPPAGPLTLVLEWPSFAIAETRYELGAGAVLDASARVLDLWPGEPSMVDDWIPVATAAATEEPGEAKSPGEVQS
jgi:hypothetical protein